ncbi:MAG: 5-formyltetrahydrofolate cyclo-ligase [Bacillota bacterium]
MKEKEKMRTEYLNQRSKIPLEKITKWSEKITNKFFKLEEVKKAKSIMSYVSFRKEVQTYNLMERLLDEGYILYVPYTIKEKTTLGIAEISDLEKDLKPGVFGVREPLTSLRTEIVPDDLDIIIVPGAVFTKEGYRIGYGGGFYDGFLGKNGDDKLKIAFTYDQFIIDEIPVEDHDIPVDMIITEKEVIDCRNEV